jgi:hypothetical protein
MILIMQWKIIVPLLKLDNPSINCEDNSCPVIINTFQQIDRSRFSSMHTFHAPGGFGNVISAIMDSIEPVMLKSSGNTIDMREFMIL